MKDEASLRLKLKEILDRLAMATEKLKFLSQGELEGSSLHTLQNEQESLLAQAHELSVVFRCKYHKKVVDLGEEHCSSLRRFEKANQTFIENLTIRKNVKKRDLDEVLQSRVVLNKLKESYGNTASSQCFDKVT